MYKSSYNSLILVFVLAMLASPFMKSQVAGKQIGRKYRTTDAKCVFRDRVMLLYTDNTFINYGIVNDVANLDMYIWYASGSWTLEGNRITCNARIPVLKNEEMVVFIKNEYRNHAEYPLIENYYDFLNVPLRDYVYVDLRKEIGYMRIHNVN